MKANQILILFVLIAALLAAGCSPRARVGDLRSESQVVELEDAGPVRVEILMGAGDLEVAGGAAELLEAGFTYNVDEIKPEVTYKKGRLVVRQPDVDGMPALRGILDYRNEWDLRLNDEVPLDLRLDMGGGSADLRLAGLSLTRLDANLGAGEYKIDLSGDWARDLEASIDAGAADIVVHLPGDTGVRVEVETGPTLIEAPGMKKNGNVYTNAAYGESAVTLRIKMESGIGRITLDVEEQQQAKAALQDLLEEQVKKQGILGMVMAARLADGTVIWDTAGYTGPSGEERWSANTISLIASVTKTFTAVVVMQLVEEGKLSLDDTVDTWFPEQPDGDKITVRMLLSHTSGLGEYQESLGMDPEKLTREWTPEELISLANQSGSVGTPGNSRAHYSNTNYIMLGRIIEKVTGNTWAYEVESRIIHPLGLEDTTVVNNDFWSRKVVPGYMKTSDGYLNLMEHPWYPHISPSIAWAAGGIGSSASDLLTFATALFDGRLVSRETLDIMAQPVGAGGGRTWALGGGVMEVNGHKAYAMGGDSTGYHSFFIGTLDGRYIVTALVNTNEGDVISPSMDALRLISQ